MCRPKSFCAILTFVQLTSLLIWCWRQSQSNYYDLFARLTVANEGACCIAYPDAPFKHRMQNAAHHLHRKSSDDRCVDCSRGIFARSQGHSGGYHCAGGGTVLCRRMHIPAEAWFRQLYPSSSRMQRFSSQHFTESFKSQPTRSTIRFNRMVPFGCTKSARLKIWDLNRAQWCFGHRRR